MKTQKETSAPLTGRVGRLSDSEFMIETAELESVGLRKGDRLKTTGKRLPRCGDIVIRQSRSKDSFVAVIQKRSRAGLGCEMVACLEQDGRLSFVFSGLTDSDAATEVLTARAPLAKRAVQYRSRYLVTDDNLAMLGCRKGDIIEVWPEEKTQAGDLVLVQEKNSFKLRLWCPSLTGIMGKVVKP